MTTLLQHALLPGVAPWVTLLLCVTGMLAAFLTTAIGAGGGLLLLAVMTLFMPVTGVIPLHGAIQFGANGVRAALLVGHVRMPLLLAFAVGAGLGAAVGAQLLVRLPEAWLQLLLGGSIIVLAWVRLPAGARLPAGGAVAAGAVTTVLTLFAGATGPLVAAALRTLGLDRLGHVATFSACMLLQHGMKLVVFAFAGFAFAPYLPFLVVMLLCSLVGTWFGRIALLRLDDVRFHRLLALLLTLLALRLLYSGTIGLFGP